MAPEVYPVNYGITELLARTSGVLWFNLVLTAGVLLKWKQVSHWFVYRALKTVKYRESLASLGSLFQGCSALLLAKHLLSSCLVQQAPHPQVPLHSRCEALRAGLSNDKDDGSYSMEVLLRLRRWMLFIKTTSIKKKTVVVRGDSLKGNRRPSMQTWPT